MTYALLLQTCDRLRHLTLADAFRTYIAFNYSFKSVHAKYFKRQEC